MRDLLAKLFPAVFRSGENHHKQNLLKLPNEILCEIGSFISPISRACLALSCKRLLSVYGEALSSPNIHFPVSFHFGIQIRRVDSLSSERWQFLGYLENRRWRRCFRCLKLHPVSEFSRAALLKRAEKRGCNMGRYAGIVELCPCTRLTYRDKLRLVDRLRLDPSRPRTVTDLDLSANSPHEAHSCTIPGPPTFFTRIFLVLEDDGLTVLTIYKADYSQGRGWNNRTPPRQICPHMDAVEYLQNMKWATFWPNRSLAPYHTARVYMSCGWCGMGVGSHRAQYTDQKCIAKASFKTIRDLGENSKVPREAWFKQKIYCQDPPVDLKGQDADPGGRLHQIEMLHPDWN